ncbi:helix-turn-helix domain-containing protein [Taylorella equigenitalis]|uniref:Phage repressor n=2 Tax=Taylorella equigenitalis TaxID=29575 RepID=A0A654KFD7_TAYEM|nr:helix-turn-helix transcriptional regulator [Taylorella equigenitalis]ADU91120.1 Putative phage repressor [Taylorella equigenitalis MCE9]AFN36224.1 putative phage repressor [Taylorella equigenitalis ATCC 35865]ASY39624.1 transcriptional regulator [Taylorella equigenitalis]WDU48984.1 helix-turn-helix transcriptional regulator [Taylorella equigenitalis]WDU51460.1 helix-turn-helix transcriptional regulator [Taylorella equigenitalis]
MFNMNDRLQLAMKERNVKQADLVRITGLSRSSISAWVTGSTKTLRGENLLKVANFLGVNLDWLTYGIGQMDSTWPFRRVTPNQLNSLSEEHLEEIEEIILLKLSRKYKYLSNNNSHKL